MVMGEIGREYSLAIIGGGPAGYMAAIRAGQLGLDTVLIEKEDIGGECLNRGCIPSKMLLNVAGLVRDTEYLRKIGISASIGKIDMKKVQAENRRVIQKLRKGVEFLLDSYGVKIIRGEARFESSGHILIKKEKDGGGLESIRFRNAIIATGSIPYIPKEIKIRGNVITSREALFLEKIPKRIAIIGAGYVAAELGTFFAEMGAEVYLLARSRLLSRFDQELVAEVARSKNSRMSIYEKCTIVSLRQDKKGVVIEFTAGENGKLQKLRANKAVVAIGRVPNTAGLGLENTKIKLDKDGFICVNERMQTGEPNVYAAGDCVGGQLLAHKAFMQGLVAAEAAAGIKGSVFEPRSIPEIVFTNPEIAVVGMSEDEARKRGYDVKAIKFPFSALGRAVAESREDGLVKIICDSNNRILGFGMVGKHASELAGEAGVALEMNAYVEDIAATVHAHPTFYESIHEAMEIALGKPMHYLLKKK
ncbi:MAG: dihydrolipoyl dehydrogenase [Candidatus Micrarchaeota archaeon]|nr:dihydrolipoyl dehydrogenase [Candidatus Micrarchaeota archaeon]